MWDKNEMMGLVESSVLLIILTWSAFYMNAAASDGQIIMLMPDDLSNAGDVQDD